MSKKKGTAWPDQSNSGNEIDPIASAEQRKISSRHAGRCAIDRAEEDGRQPRTSALRSRWSDVYQQRAQRCSRKNTAAMAERVLR
jgi:hypothetical protein